MFARVDSTAPFDPSTHVSEIFETNVQLTRACNQRNLDMTLNRADNKLWRWNNKEILWFVTPAGFNSTF